MGKSKAAPEKVIAAERRVKALELRKLGFTYRRIGEQLGVTEAGAHKMVTKSLRELDEKSAESAIEVRRLELERLDGWTLRVAQEIEKGRALRAIDRGLRIQARRAKLLGLDAPTKLELGQVTDELVKSLVEASNAGDPVAAQAIRELSEGKVGLLPAWSRWWNGAQVAVVCTADDIAKMTPEEIQMAAQGQLQPYQLEEIRKRPAGEGEAAGDDGSGG